MIEEKLRLAMLCRNKWPMHASIDEDVKFRKETWNFLFPPNFRQRAVMHDNTNATLKELLDATQHKAMRSEC